MKMKGITMKTPFSVIPAFITFLLLCGVATAQSQVKGAMSGRSGATMTVKTVNSGSVTVVLTSRD